MRESDGVSGLAEFSEEPEDPPDEETPVDFDYQPVRLTSSFCRLFISHRARQTQKHRRRPRGRALGTTFAARNKRAPNNSWLIG